MDQPSGSPKCDSGAFSDLMVGNRRSVVSEYGVAIGALESLDC